ncbi:XXYS1_4_G0030090.mRNA.1.CDS.1 [Saccharomyces cerevisiae]|nr:XXYS1_4_G0030090.mRNA.1.CDS.1 [Saccharomyces cerevisiae]
MPTLKHIFLFLISVELQKNYTTKISSTARMDPKYSVEEASTKLDQPVASRPLLQATNPLANCTRPRYSYLKTEVTTTNSSFYEMGLMTTRCAPPIYLVVSPTTWLKIF